MSISPVHCVSQVTLLSLRWTFVVVQLWPGGDGGGWLEFCAAQNLTVFGFGLNGMPSMTTCEVDCQRTPGASARAGAKATRRNADAASRRPDHGLIMISSLNLFEFVPRRHWYAPGAQGLSS